MRSVDGSGRTLHDALLFWVTRLRSYPFAAGRFEEMDLLHVEGEGNRGAERGQRLRRNAGDEGSSAPWIYLVRSRM